MQKQLYKTCVKYGCSRATVWYGLALLRMLGIALLCAIAVVASAVFAPRFLRVVLILAGIVILVEVKHEMFTSSFVANGIGVFLVALVMGACVYGILRTLCGHYEGAEKQLLIGIMSRCVKLNVSFIVIATVASPVMMGCLMLWIKLLAWVKQR